MTNASNLVINERLSLAHQIKPKTFVF